MRGAALLLCACCACADATAQAVALNDPGPSGPGPRERSSCEPPEHRPGWCEWPHEVRAFVEDRDACDHFRGEPWPQGADADSRARRGELQRGMRTACTGTDARLADLLQRYAGSPGIASTLSAYERNVEGGNR